MSVADEFVTVDVVLASDAETRGVDAFALALLKAERQMRKLVTYLAFQSPSFQPADVVALRDALGQRRLYFRHFLAAWDDLYPVSLSQLVGPDHDRLRAVLDDATEYRNKIFHGQLTAKYLTREELIAFVSQIRCWCTALAASAQAEVGFDGFGEPGRRDSFTKAADISIGTRLRVPLTDVGAYEKFLAQLGKRSNKGYLDSSRQVKIARRFR